MTLRPCPACHRPTNHEILSNVKEKMAGNFTVMRKEVRRCKICGTVSEWKAAEAKK